MSFRAKTSFNPLLNNNNTLSDDEEEEQCPHAYPQQHNHQHQQQQYGYNVPYASTYGFTTTSWQLKRNLTNVFDQQAMKDKEECKFQKVNKGEVPSDNTHHEQKTVSTSFVPTTKTNVTHKIAQFEEKLNASSTFSSNHQRSNSGAEALFGRPPRQPNALANQDSKFNNDSNTKTATIKTAPSASVPPTAATTIVSGEKKLLSVYLRVRPPKDSMINTIEIVPGDPPTKVRTHAPQRSNAAKINRDSSASASTNTSSNTTSSDAPMVVREFDFQRVFGPQQSNQELYQHVVAPIVQDMFPANPGDSPKSGLLFAYGATNAGKTYSILGKLPTSHGYSHNNSVIKDQNVHHGIVPRAFKDILQHMEQAQAREPDQCFDLFMSYFEIYNENIYDLLDDRDHSNPMFLREPLKLRERKNQTFVQGLNKKQIRSLEEGMQLARQANSKRHTSSNNLNSGSSRSHCICQLQVTKSSAVAVHSNNDTTTAATTRSIHNTDDEASQLSHKKQSTLWVVDLAGSERSKRTNVGSMRQKEASLINKSLMNLMRCLSIMRENQAPSSASQVIPFRENKLTHLFMPIFTGRSASRISMIVNVNPAAPDFDETNHVLSYASKAKMVQIEDKPIVARPPQQTFAEYGYNGRPIKKQKTAISRLASLVKKLSPKKFIKRTHSNPNSNTSIIDENKDNMSNTSNSNSNSETNLLEAKQVNQVKVERKRKATPPLAGNLSLNDASDTMNISQVYNVSNGNGNNERTFETKRMQIVRQDSQRSMQRSNSSPSLASTNDEKSLKMALLVAQAEIEALKLEKVQLSEELAHVETNVREEVSDEMEAQIERTKLHYTKIIDQMKAESRQSMGVFEKQAREERAAEQIDLLIFKVEECEEEMKRQGESHSKMIASLKAKHEKEISAQAEEIRSLRAQLANASILGSSTSTLEACHKEDTMAIQKHKLLEQEKEIAALKRSKEDLIASYESLLENGDDDKDDEDSESDEEGSDDDDLSTGASKKNSNEMRRLRALRKFGNKSSSSKHTIARSQVAKTSKTKAQSFKVLGQRAPLSSISENAP